jgi:hypothetical protein
MICLYRLKSAVPPDQKLSSVSPLSILSTLGLRPDRQKTPTSFGARLEGLLDYRLERQDQIFLEKRRASLDSLVDTCCPLRHQTETQTVHCPLGRVASAFPSLSIDLAPTTRAPRIQEATLLTLPRRREHLESKKRRC